VTDEKVYTARNRNAYDESPHADEAQAYAASKVNALNDSEQWIDAKNTSFDLVNIHPPFVVGRDGAVTTPKDVLRGTNGVILPCSRCARYRQSDTASWLLDSQ